MLSGWSKKTLIEKSRILNRIKKEPIPSPVIIGDMITKYNTGPLTKNIESKKNLFRLKDIYLALKISQIAPIKNPKKEDLEIISKLKTNITSIANFFKFGLIKKCCN